jgi:hypothetical protein
MIKNLENDMLISTFLGKVTDKTHFSGKYTHALLLKALQKSSRFHVWQYNATMR